MTPSHAVLDLAGTWQLTDETGEYSCPMRVPGDGITALHEAGLIPDPYWGRNEYGLRWISERDWTITRRFVLERTDVALVLEGVDTVATVHLNGVEVRRTANAFRRVTIPGTGERSLVEAGALRAGENEIAITFHSAPREAAGRAALQPFPVPYIAQNNPIPHGNMLRKPACDWGWDWNIALCPFGVTGGVHVDTAEGAAVYIAWMEQEHRPGEVTVKVGAWVRAALAGQPYVFRLGDRTCEGVVPAPRAKQRYISCRAEFIIENPELWWPAGLGTPTLHDLVVTCGGHEERRRIGLRTIDLVTEKDTAGLSFGFRVNGRMVFAKGANWIPADALAGRITVEKTRDLLESAVAANMNMIRVWGGGRYEADSFYDACDELGLMVWQDAMLSCNLYPSDEDFLSEVYGEVYEQAERIALHPCLALWCGDNELIGALNWFEESRKDRDRYLVSYDRLNRQVEAAVGDKGGPDANWWPSSPSPGPLNFRDAWHEDGSGDMHFWSVWHEGKDFDHYREVQPRFCSEFGFQSYPSMQVIRTFADPADWNIAAPVFESHQKNQGGNARIAETMFRYFRWPERFEDFVWLSQVQQGLAMKTAVTAWRALKPHCQGALYWQLNDTWPCCSWSSLDYGGGWKVLHHMARDFFRPVTVVAIPGAEGIALVGVNDTLDPVEMTVTAYATAVDGTAREIGRGGATVGEAAERLLLVDPGSLGEQEVLTFGWEASDGSRAGDIVAPKPWKAYELPDPGLAFDVAQDGATWTLSVTAQAMAFFVTAEADVPGRWSRNAIHLGPGAVSRLVFTPREPGAAPRFLLRDLHSATVRRPSQGSH